MGSTGGSPGLGGRDQPRTRTKESPSSQGTHVPRYENISNKASHLPFLPPSQATNGRPHWRETRTSASHEPGSTLTLTLTVTSACIAFSSVMLSHRFSEKNVASVSSVGSRRTAKASRTKTRGQVDEGSAPWRRTRMMKEERKEGSDCNAFQWRTPLRMHFSLTRECLLTRTGRDRRLLFHEEKGRGK